MKKKALLAFLLVFLSLSIYLLINQFRTYEEINPVIKGRYAFLEVNLKTEENGTLILKDPEGPKLDSESITDKTIYLRLNGYHENPVGGTYSLILKKEDATKLKKLELKDHELGIKETEIKLEEMENGFYSLEKINLKLENKGDLPAFFKAVIEVEGVKKETGFKSILPGHKNLNLTKRDIKGGFSFAPSTYNVKLTLENKGEVLAQTTKEITLD